MHSQVILSNLNKNGINIFDEVIEQIEYEFNKPTRSLEEMKQRDNKKRKGDIWEHFCRDWLAASGNYERVMFLTEFNEEYPDVFISKQDNGIDLLGETTTGWHAIQCKYRNCKQKYVPWNTLSTFIALCERTCVFEKYVVITNCLGVTHKLPRTPKDKSICYRALHNTSRDQWLKMVGLFNPQKLSDADQPIEAETAKVNKRSKQTRTAKQRVQKPKVLSLEELREKRLAYYDNLHNQQ